MLEGYHSQGGGATPANMIPALTGVLYNSKHEKARVKTMSCDKSFGVDVPDGTKLWRILAGLGYQTAYAATCGNHMMGVKTCSWNDEFHHQMPILGAYPKPGDRNAPWTVIGCDLGGTSTNSDVGPTKCKWPADLKGTHAYNARGQTPTDFTHYVLP